MGWLQLVYDGVDDGAVKLLGSIRSVQLIHLHPPWATSEDTAKFEFYAQQAKQWGGQPGNYELMVKQGETKCDCGAVSIVFRQHTSHRPGCHESSH